ncbi:trimeric intracellular cation channel family protein [Stakelama sp. CBK3Z-3]|uniref:Trimeric intracellular cation channel family protein n=1 Tax=Stakelama flava TaxID=2860338 RepID=A0ABS6XK89_9SPHN|nr:trimeric intracellular cation channel family protein [Stakelama flava]MBW4330624.1 trimeric intracellular cation channel family protein [Stakelama flava]
MTPPLAWQIGPLLPWLDLVSIAVFAATGAVAATRAGQTLVTATFFALITGVGGGTLRDLLIDAPVFWVHDRLVAGICIAVATLVWVTPERWWQGKVFAWLDASGLAAYAVFGAAKSLGFGIPPVPAIVLGIVNACAGGIIRDMLANEPSILMRPELYVTAAALAASAYVGLHLLGAPSFVAALAATGAGFGLRGAAIHWKIALPAYRGKR